MSQDSLSHNSPRPQTWYAEVTRYQWLVLLIASLGWVFDVFEGQIFVASMNEAMPELLSVSATDGDKRFVNNITLGAFSIGGALGGIAFGILSDRIGRKRVMTYTILMYSMFTCLSAFSTHWWHMAAFRFLVALGVGGEWAVASAMVAEVVPAAARARLLGVFHASSVFGTLMAVAVGALVIPHFSWRVGFVIGVLPALLIIWIRTSLKEPDTWEKAKGSANADVSKRLGNFRELFGASLIRNTLVGVGLATVGLTTFWGAHIYGKDMMRRDIEKRYLAAIDGLDPTERRTLVAEAIAEARDHFQSKKRATLEETTQAAELVSAGIVESSVHTHLSLPLDAAERPVLRPFRQEVRGRLLEPFAAPIKRWEMAGMLATTLGGGIGLLCFGPLCEWSSRRGTFLFFHIGGLVSALVLFQMVHGVTNLLMFLPVFGFLTLGMHAGYAIYFPELFPTRLRGTGGGFCFNVGRVMVAPILFVSGWLQRTPASGGIGLTLEESASLLSLLFLVGVVLLFFARETKGQELPE